MYSFGCLICPKIKTKIKYGIEMTSKKLAFNAEIISKINDEIKLYFYKIKLLKKYNFNDFKAFKIFTFSNKIKLKIYWEL